MRYLLGKGHDVLGFSRSKEPEDVFLPYKGFEERRGRFHFEQADLNKHIKKLIEIINAEKPAYIINFAAQGMVAESWLKPEDWYQTNVVSQVKLHNQLRQFDFIENYLQYLKSIRGNYSIAFRIPSLFV